MPNVEHVDRNMKTKSQLSGGIDLLDSTMHSYYNMRPTDIANKTLRLNAAEQTGMSFAKRNQSEDGAS